MSDKIMPLQPIGKTGLSVSTLGFGGAPIGGFWFDSTEQQGADTVATSAIHSATDMSTLACRSLLPERGPCLHLAGGPQNLRGSQDQL